MIRAVVISLLGAVGLLAGPARTWISTEGKELDAELLSYDSAAGRVVLKRTDGQELRFAVGKLGEADRQWLRDWEEARKGWLDKRGTIQSFRTENHRVRYHVYCPKAYEPGKPLPLIFLFGSGGDGRGMVEAFRGQLEEISLMAVGCDGVSAQGGAERRRERFGEILSEVEEKVPHDGRNLYMGGFAFGAEHGFELLQAFDRPWKGVFAASAALAAAQDVSKLPEGLRVVMTHGTFDLAGKEDLAADRAILAEQKCTVSTIDFEGGRQLPPPDVLERVLRSLVK